MCFAYFILFYKNSLSLPVWLSLSLTPVSLEMLCWVLWVSYTYFCTLFCVQQKHFQTTFYLLQTWSNLKTKSSDFHLKLVWKSLFQTVHNLGINKNLPSLGMTFSDQSFKSFFFTDWVVYCLFFLNYNYLEDSSVQSFENKKNRI